jgi:hypothetical protein
MVEFSLPTLYTGNRSKLGEVLISANDMSREIESVLAIRLPGSMLSVVGRDVYVSPSSLTSHSAIYEHRAAADRATA